MRGNAVGSPALSAPHLPSTLVSHLAFIGLRTFVLWKPRADVSAGWGAVKRRVCDARDFPARKLEPISRDQRTSHVGLTVRPVFGV